MESLVLKDTILCECGEEMFPLSMDKSKKTIIYRCIDPTCAKTVEKSFNEVTLKPDELRKYFYLNTDGNVTWKCHIHGYCDFDMSLFSSDWQNTINRFVETYCGMCKSAENINNEKDYVDIDRLKEKFQNLDQNQKFQLAEVMQADILDYEDYDDDDYAQSFLDLFFHELEMGEQVESWDDFESIIDDILKNL